LAALALCTLLLALDNPAAAQQPAKLPRIGFLATVSPSVIADRVEAFRRGLREHGYVEGKNIVIEWRFAEGKPESEVAAELVRLKVDIIVTVGSPGTRSAEQATGMIPIVMTQDPDPVANGFVASLARPGGNITGLATLAPETSEKRLELLKETVPKLSRVAVIGTSTRPGNAQALKQTELAAETFDVRVQFLDVLISNHIETAFRVASKERSQAMLVLAGLVLNSHRKQITELAMKNRLPAMYERAEFMDVNGLMFYGPSLTELSRRAATYIDKILKGAKPADLPVEQPTKFELIINLKAAQQIGLTIPPNVLARADRVIR